MKFLPLFQMLFLWLNQTPPEWNSPLSFQDGFNRYQLEIYWDASFWKTYTNWKYHTNLKYINNTVPIENFILKFFEMVVVRSFCFGLNISPPLALIAKNGVFWEPFLLSPPLVQVNMSGRLYQFESDVEWWRRVNDTDRVEWKPCLRRRLHFPFNLWLSRNALEYTLVIALVHK